MENPWNCCLVLCVLLCCLSASLVRSARWAHSAMLSPDYRLLWSLGPGPQDITFELQVRTLGYVGFGFSKNGQMAGADMIIGWVDQGQVYFQDRHVKETPGNLMDREPEVDPSQDYQLLLGYENNTHTVLRFRRRLDTCDYHDIPITNDTMRVIWAFHKQEPICGAVGPGSLPRHELEVHGIQSLFLVQRADQDLPGPEETANVWELRNPAVEPPAPGDTLYWCKVFRLPVSRKHHLIRYEPLQGVRGATSGLQHVVLYECQDSSQVRALVGTPGKQCDEGEPLSCSAVVASWARGSEGFSFPLEAGFPLEPSLNRYYLLETHYTGAIDDNSDTIEGSGLRLYYTPELRRHDAGVISIGIDPNWRHIIPPRQHKVVSSGHCISECTHRAFPNTGINMFAVVMRTHRIGRQVSLRHVRGNAELPPIATDENLDADYQEYRKLETPLKVLPGDHLIAECTYDSSERSAITLGGLTSREETCLVMGLYYPRQKALASCHSLPSLPTVLHSLGIQELSPATSLGESLVTLSDFSGGYLLLLMFSGYQIQKIFKRFEKRAIVKCYKIFFLFQGTEKLETYYPNITKPYVRSEADQCTYKRYSTEGWPGGTPLLELNGNHIEGAARSKVSRSSVPTGEESLGLSRINSAVSRTISHIATALLTTPLIFIR
ncbi:MOXD1 homolog 2 [Agrilus planipennis]|uniref:MOXD1 homolog 2 n=1 Tax=Agrilus planipennis TaxID=224129 RepID=A0A7F5RMR3_AGRPL|nr:MOXD1 homolog 2 [Agrilus planipennis]